MFDISWGEMLVVGVVALIVIGPKELPGTIRAVGRGVAKLRTMAGEFRAQFDDAMREAELQDVKKDFTDLRESARTIITDTLAPVKEDFAKAADEMKSGMAEASGGAASRETLGTIEADARSLEAEVKGADGMSIEGKGADKAERAEAASPPPEAANSTARPGNAA